VIHGIVDAYNPSQCQRQWGVRRLTRSVVYNGFPSRNANGTDECQHTEEYQRRNGGAKSLEDGPLRIDGLFRHIGDAFNTEEEPDGERNRSKDAGGAIGQGIGGEMLHLE
jgi:hypothetical protein